MADPESTTEEKTDGSSRAWSTAPYFDLEASIKVADVIYNNGGGACTGDQLAMWLDYKTVRSGTFLTRVSAANKHFGLIGQQGDRFVVTERAQKILTPVMPDDAVTAKVEAFLSVPLFAKVYEQFRGTQIPKEVGLRNLFQSTYKLLPDRASSAVRIFLNSAEQAGLLTPDRSRLVKPVGVAATNNKPAAVEKKEEAQPGPIDRSKFYGGGEQALGVHSAIIGLLRELPPSGTVWPEKKKKQFLDAFRATLDFIYQDEENAS
jgi:hypothetical protein